MWGSEAETGWCRQSHMNFILDNLIAAGKSKPMIVVMEKGYVRRTGPGRRRGHSRRLPCFRGPTIPRYSNLDATRRESMCSACPSSIKRGRTLNHAFAAGPRQLKATRRRLAAKAWHPATEYHEESVCPRSQVQLVFRPAHRPTVCGPQIALIRDQRYPELTPQ